MQTMIVMITESDGEIMQGYSHNIKQPLRTKIPVKGQGKQKSFHHLHEDSQE